MDGIHLYMDVSKIVPHTCTYILDSETIQVYDSGASQVTKYKIIGNTFYPVETFQQSVSPSGVACYSTTDIQQLPSKYDFIMPIFTVTSMIFFVLLVFFAYRLILHPFFRSKV